MSVLFLCFSLPVNAEERVAISTPEPPDYRQGIIDDGRNIKAINLPSQFIDNNLSTGYRMLGGYNWYVEFLYPTDISAMFLDMIDSGRGTLTITFESGYTTSITFDGTQSGYQDLGFYGVVKIGLKRTGVESLTMREVEFFGTYYVGVPQDVMNLTKTEGDGEVTLKYTIPDGLKVNIYVDGQKVVEELTVSTYRLSNLENGRTYRITVKTVDPHGVESAGVTIEATPQADTTPPGEVPTLLAVAGDGEVTLRYSKPADKDFSHYRIYVDDQLVADYVTVTTYKVTGLQNGKKYTLRVTTVDQKGNESNGKTVTATPYEISREVSNLRVTARHDSVDLSWQNPKRSDFQLVKIYRKEIEEKAIRFLPVAHAEDYKELFETNGTFFRDLTVEPETSYEYKLTTVTGGQESAGVTVQVTTSPIPPPSTGGATIIRHENGDVTVRWPPQPGWMLIEIDGQEYKKVDAQLGEYTIPAEDIPVYEDGRQAPIRLIPIAPNGEQGKPIIINPGGWLVNLPFGAKELLQAGLDLLLVLGPIVLLALAICYVRPILRVIRQAAGRARS